MVIYRGSGVLNFAHGAIGMVGAYVEWEVKEQRPRRSWSPGPAGLLACAAIGALTHLLIMRRLRRASPLARIVATLGVLIVLQAGAVLRYGSKITFVTSELPVTVLHPFDITISLDRFILVGIAAVLSVALWALYRYTQVRHRHDGRRREPARRSAVGLSPDWIATVNWALGSALAGVAAILIAPIVQLQVADDDEPRAGGDGGRARRQLPVVPDRLRRRDAHRHRPDRAHPLRRHAGRGHLAPVRRDHPVDAPARPGAAAARLLPAAPAGRRQRPRPPGRHRRRGRGHRARHHGRADPLAGRASSRRSRWASCCCRSSSSPATPASCRSGQFALAGFGAWVAGRLVDAGGWPFWLAAARRRRRPPSPSGRCSPSRPCGPAASTSPSSRSAWARRWS